jgi:capsular polysaccharide biosynthesis protein
MAEQLDVRSVLSLLRRRRRTLAATVLVGAALGGALVTWQPPQYASTSRVLLPERPLASDGQDSTWDATTQVSIAESGAVLGPAARSVQPHLSSRAVRERVSVSAPAADVLEITARGPSASAAESLAKAVAQSEVASQAEATSSLSTAQMAALRERRDTLQRSLDAVNEQLTATQQRLDEADPAATESRQDASAIAQLTAQQTQLVLQINELKAQLDDAAGSSGARVIEEATAADRPALLLWYGVAGAAGALLALALVIGFLVSLARRDSKLSTRDEVADAVGSEVVASLRSQVPRSVAGWHSLMRDYAPGVAEGWALRLALSALGLQDDSTARPTGRNGKPRPAPHRQVCVLSLEDDVRALSVGPQLASYAASIGIDTRLVPEQVDATAALWAACSSAVDEEELRPGLRVAPRRRTKSPAELTVVVGVLDRRSPRIPRLERAATVVLAVASRAASSEDLARAAVAAYDAGYRIAGVVLADPDPLDRTTGRLLPHERVQQPSLPSRVSGPRPVATAEPTWRGGAS